MHILGPKMQSKKLSTGCVMLNFVGPNAPIQVRMLASPNHFEEELPKDNGLPEDLPKDKTKIKVLPNGEGRLAQMSATNHLLFQKLKKKCSLQEKTFKKLSESLHLSI